MTTPSLPAALDVLQSRLAARVAAVLERRSAELPRDVAERLRASREQALAVARARRRAAALAASPLVAGRSSQGSVVLGSPSPRWLKLASGVPLVLLLVGLLAIDHWTQLEQVHAAAEIDALLLADELPPRAYADPGFVEFLKAPRP